MSLNFIKPGPVADPFLGGWSLIGYTKAIAEGSEPISPLGSRPGGMITYTSGGAVSAQLVAMADDAQGNMPRFTSYFGSFQIDTERKYVVHHVHSATQIELIGRPLERHYRFEGDRLILSAMIGTDDHVLTWQRIGEME